MYACPMKFRLVDKNSDLFCFFSLLLLIARSRLDVFIYFVRFLRVFINNIKQIRIRGIACIWRTTMACNVIKQEKNCFVCVMKIKSGNTSKHLIGTNANIKPK